MKPHISTALGMSIGFFGSLIYLWTPWGTVLPIAMGVFLGGLALFLVLTCYICLSYRSPAAVNENTGHSGTYQDCPACKVYKAKLSRKTPRGPRGRFTSPRKHAKAM